MSYTRLVRIMASLCLTIASVLVFVPVNAAQIAPAPGTESSATSAPPAQRPGESTSAAPAPQPYAGPTAAQCLDGRLELGDGRDIWRPTRAQLGFSLAPGVDPNGPASLTRYVANREKAIAYFTGIAPFVQRPPVSARPVVLASYATNPLAVRASSVPVPAKILPGRDGAALEIDKAADVVIGCVISDPAIVHIALPLRLQAARISLESVLGIDARIGHFVTHFNPREAGRTKTVRRAISMIDDHVVAPGAIFSVNDTVGERTEKRGFGIGHVFVDGQMKKDVGGGMCQVATTLFNAALLANLQIVERHQHVRTVPYVKPGSDATVWFGKKDFKLRNDTAYPIFISYRTTSTYAICDVYGKSTKGVHIDVQTYQRRNAQRDYFGSITRYTTIAGRRAKTYEAFSRYKWTPALDFSH
ncbi:MAG: VanW family protein [Capsulimonadaceae bacterium]|nr:VanW family protein [Capsulimonadaceae bacterium]